MDPITPHPLIPQIREASRLLVREFGFMAPTLAGTDLSASAVHAIIEIGQSTSTTASTLSKTLNIDRSNISRTLSKLVEAGYLTETPNTLDARQKILSITEGGRDILGKINKFASEQVMSALEILPPGSSPEDVLYGIQAYASTLRAQRIGKAVQPAAIVVVSGYMPGLLGRCLEMHMRYYSRTVGFGVFFEAQLATGLGDLLMRLDGPRNEVWTATDGTKILGTIFIDGDGLSDGKVHLRAFIVDDALRGHGFGRKMIDRAMAYADEQKFEETHLYTFKGLDAARRLYESCGFALAEESLGNKWGKEMLVQHFVRRMRGVVSTQEPSI